MAKKYDFSILRKLRLKHDMTLEQLADASGLSYPTVASIETNKTFPSLKTIDAIAEALEVSASRLISLVEQKEVKVRRTESIHAKTLENCGINLRKLNVANYDDLKIFRASVEPGVVVNSMKLHDDCDCHEVCYCLSGSLDIRVRNETHRLSADDVIFFDGTVDHEYTAREEAEYVVMHLPKEAIRLESLLEIAAT